MFNGIGFAGRMKAGKDTAARYAADKILQWKGSNFGIRQLAFAKPLKDIAMVYMGLNKHHCYDQEGKAEFNEFWGMTNREILQKLGDGMRREVHPDFWTKLIERKLHDCIEEGEMFILTDVRYPNEAELIRKYGGIIIQLNRQCINPPEGTVDHPSERPLDSQYVDFSIDNDFSLEELRDNVNSIIQQCKYQ